MSSKILSPDDPRSVARLVFRQIPSLEVLTARPATTNQPEAPEGPPPDYAARIALLERQNELRVRDGHAAGVREGEAVGRNLALAEIQPVLDRLARTIQEIGGFRE